MTNALERLLRLRGVTFEWINSEDHANQQGTQGGFIAQEVEDVFPKWISEVDGAEHDRKLTENGKIKSLTLPFEFDALVVEAIKEQQAQIRARDKEIEELKQRLDAGRKSFATQNQRRSRLTGQCRKFALKCATTLSQTSPPARQL